VFLSTKIKYLSPMNSDGHKFLKRAHWFFNEVKSNRYPNAQTLAAEFGVSRNTAQRTIYRLRDEYLVPLDYNASEKGFFLLTQDFILPALLPPGKDEMIALLLAREMVDALEAEDLKEKLDNLWLQYASSNAFLARELEPLTEIFSCDSTVIADIADRGVLTYLEAASSGENIRLEYKSPWRHQEPKTYEGRIVKVHFSDGSLYLLFADTTGREIVLNTSFIKSFEVLTQPLEFTTLATGQTRGSENWREGFGIWAGEDLEEIEVEILSPASEYFAEQRWHAQQEDTWDGDCLIRKFPGIVSPEVVRRVLSLGRFVRAVRPQALADKVLSEARELVERVAEGAPGKPR
jgi:predicted DNA-binding transcriptional regulator YafY